MPESYFKESSILDESTTSAIEIDNLTKGVLKLEGRMDSWDDIYVAKNAATLTGRSFILNLLRNPLLSVKEVKEKQEGLAEIRSNDKLREGIEKLLEQIKGYEKDAEEFMHHGGGFFSYDSYENQRGARTLICELPLLAKELPTPESNYLKRLKQDLENLNGSAVRKLAEGPIFRRLFKKQVRGLRELIQNPELVSPLPFNPFHIKTTTTLLGAIIPVAALLGGYYAGGGNFNPQSNLEMKEIEIAVVGSTIVFLIGGIAGKMIGNSRDRKNFFRPMIERFTNEAEAKTAYIAIGRLDELMTYDKFGKQLPRSCIPEVFDSPKHHFTARNLINPVQCKYIKDYVPNDVEFGVNGQRLTFLTGPNSGGKTSLGKSIAQAQVLAQIGCYVPADYARISLADHIFYQVGRNDNLGDKEGGLGTQFEQTKEILFTSTPRSLVIIDDLIEGTTFNEKTRHTRNQLCGFLHKRANTVYISHHHELAQEFMRQGIGDYWQVEFDGNKPTHKIIPGISTNSHSDEVARRVGFDEEAITAHLIETGYLQEGQKLTDIGQHGT
ncbi:hypothetical protein HYX19_00640 [Candidatus Woesearchaeota archaeon]|nr:hypothetical protein [Candidatus Woesearchaeota archaeon]